jgi:MFS family permease
MSSEVKVLSWPARLPFYYGWVNVVLAAVAMSATLPGRTYGLGLIKEPLRADLHISDVGFDTLNFWAVVIGAFAVIPVGWLIDRIGVRTALGGVAVALGASVILMSLARDRLTLFLTMTLVRGLGQGSLSLVSIAMVGKWFKRRVGPAMGVFTVLLALGFVVPIFAVGAAVHEHGWRWAWAAVGYALLFGLAPVGLLLTRSSPESCGIEPDEPLTEEAFASTSPGQALGTPSFWTLTLSATVFNLVFSALTLDNELLLNERGLNGGQANSLIMGVLMVSGLPANIIAAWLARRGSMAGLLSVGVATLAVSLVVFPMVHSLGLVAVYAVLLGVSGGIITVIYFAVYGHTYGRTHLGMIQAVVQGLTVVASALGPLLLSTCRSVLGVTAPFFHVFAVIAVVLAVLTWIVPMPNSDASKIAGA